MQTEYIAVLDSGLGGLSALKKLQTYYPNESFIYFGDGVNAPYGNKGNRALFSIVEKNLDIIKRFPIKALVLGCNTLSVNLRTQIEAYSGVKVFGVYPPVEKALSENKRVLMLSTVRTAEVYSDTFNLDVVGLKDLAINIEYNMFNLNEVNFEKSLKNSTGFFYNLKGYYDGLILGCTHYFFIKNQILNHFCPLKIYDGVDFTVRAVGEELKLSKSIEKHCKKQVLFLGDYANIYKKFYFYSG